ncbi:MAG: hypothetical protein H0U76_18640 [Ktedonobacteraceae bacterium]|nr:hypothetical protein [Ktedonobacteraceae bacterium]
MNHSTQQYQRKRFYHRGARTFIHSTTAFCGGEGVIWTLCASSQLGESFMDGCPILPARGRAVATPCGAAASSSRGKIVWTELPSHLALQQVCASGFAALAQRGPCGLAPHQGQVDLLGVTASPGQGGPGKNGTLTPRSGEIGNGTGLLRASRPPQPRGSLAG